MLRLEPVTISAVRLPHVGGSDTEKALASLLDQLNLTF